VGDVTSPGLELLLEGLEVLLEMLAWDCWEWYAGDGKSRDFCDSAGGIWDHRISQVLRASLGLSVMTGWKTCWRAL
jgi:hypothetical protein